MMAIKNTLMMRGSLYSKYLPQRNIIFMRRLQNKPVKRDPNYRHNYDEETYIKAMKRFQMEARGLIPGTPEYNSIRNKIYSEMRIQKGKDDKESAKNAIMDVTMPNFGSFYCLLIVVPESTECYETMHILRYFDFPVNVEEDNILRQLTKKEMGFRKDD